MFYRIGVISVVLFSSGVLFAQGTGTISGVCSLPDTSDWSGITIQVVGQHKSAVTNSGGLFSINNVAAGSIRIQAGKLFYRNAVKDTVLVAGQTISLFLALAKEIVDTLERHYTPRITTAATNVGNVGVPNRFIEQEDSGFTWLGLHQLKEASLMIGTDTTRVSDAARFIWGIAQDNLDRDFKSLSDIVRLKSSADSAITITAYDDSRSNQAPGYPSQPLGVLVTQTTTTYTTISNDGFLLIKLNIKNRDRFTLSNLLVGWFVDWDVGNSISTNRGGIITTENQIDGVNNGGFFHIEIAYQKASTSSGPFLGIVPLSQSKFKAARIASNQHEIIPNPPYGGLTEANKYRYMDKRRTSYTNSDYGVEENLCTIVSLGGMSGENYESSYFTLLPSQEVVTGFAFVGGSDSLELVQNAKQAQRKWVEQGNVMNIYPDTWKVGARWNLISLPLYVLDSSKIALFPSAISEAFTFIPGQGYRAFDTLSSGVGYWLKFPSAQTIRLEGRLRRVDTIEVVAGWNLIGTLTFPVAVSSVITVPNNIIQSNFFGFNNGYIASDILYPLRAYWVKVSQTGSIILQSSGW